MGLFDRILVPVDGSRPSEVGTALGLDAARQFGGTLVFVNIVDLPLLMGNTDYGATDTADIIEEARVAGDKLAKGAAQSARAQGLKAEALVLEGPVLEMLLEAIEQSRVTIVVMGSHGRGVLARALMGSTTDGLLRRSPVPVVVAPRGTPRGGASA
jgi:nucleotide-binding universal stress UspA family protein